MLDIIIPTFKRPHSLERASKNAHENTKCKHTLTFVVEPEDQESIDKINELGEKLLISKYPGNHTGAANTAYEETKEPFFIIANDDFNFHYGWDEPALEKMKDETIGVVGLNDGKSQRFTTITLVRRKYIQEHSGVMDMPNTLYYPGYNHNYVDTEFSNTAMKRNMFAICPESVVEHMHWAFGKAQMDPTYEKSNKTTSQDAHTYSQRQHLWQ